MQPTEEFNCQKCGKSLGYPGKRRNIKKFCRNCRRKETRAGLRGY